MTGLPSAFQFCVQFSMAANIRGIETQVMDIMLFHDFARGIFDAIVEVVLAPSGRYNPRYLQRILRSQALCRQ